MSQPAVSILITAYQESGSIGAALNSILNQIEGLDAEIIVICPDEETARAAALPGVKVVRDPGLGKPAALNIGFRSAQGKLLVMTDGDVVIGPGALAALLRPFEDCQTGAVSGRPLSINSRATMLGYWSHLLAEAGADAERRRRAAGGRFLVCSGYLYAIRAGLVGQIPEDALAEDALISHLIGDQGYRIQYAPEAIVWVKYPDTYRDWLKQKVRSAGGYAQPIIARSPLRMRSFRDEAISGTWRALKYARNLRELLWTFALIAARVHLWMLVLWRVRIQRRPLAELWQRVESTKQ